MAYNNICLAALQQPAMFREKLKEFELPNVEFTGEKLSRGSGSYGYVEVVSIAGTRCAAKFSHTIFEEHDWVAEKSPMDYFKEECTLMSRLRHPHIVQFLGICYRQETQLPALVMELLMTCLHNFLESEAAQLHNGIKRSILLDVSRGLVYLHGVDIVHRDLSARNVLLTTSLTAKIADLGMARMFTQTAGKLAATMTKAPGNANYMPPEAQDGDVTHYGKPIDCFSMGHLILFTITQKFPNVLASTYINKTTGFLEARNEVERRQQSFETAREMFGVDHPLILLAYECLGIQPSARPTAPQIMQWLKSMSIPFPHWNQSKYELICDVLSNEKAIHELQQELDALRKSMTEKQPKFAGPNITSLGILSLEPLQGDAGPSLQQNSTPLPLTSPDTRSKKPLYINMQFGKQASLSPPPIEDCTPHSPVVQHTYSDLLSDDDEAVFEFNPSYMKVAVGHKQTAPTRSTPPGQQGSSPHYENVCPSSTLVGTIHQLKSPTSSPRLTSVIYDDVPRKFPRDEYYDYVYHARSPSPEVPSSSTDEDQGYDNVPPKFSSLPQSSDSAHGLTPPKSQFDEDAFLNYDSDEKTKIASKLYKKKPHPVPRRIVSELTFNRVRSFYESSPPRTRVGAMISNQESPKSPSKTTHSNSNQTLIKDKSHMCSSSSESSRAKTGETESFTSDSNTHSNSNPALKDKSHMCSSSPSESSRTKTGVTESNDSSTDLDEDDFRKKSVSVSSAVFGSWTCRCTNVVHLPGGICEGCGNQMRVSTL